MNVRTALEDMIAISDLKEEVEIDGWLVIIGDDLYILDQDLPEDYKKAPKIKITDKDIIYALCEAILPLGGGESFVFHKAKIIGNLKVGSIPEITVSSLFIQERGSDEFMFVDVATEAIKAAKARYEATLSFDFFREMGDF
jgi:hypothetical protein